MYCIIIHYVHTHARTRRYIVKISIYVHCSNKAHVTLYNLLIRNRGKSNPKIILWEPEALKSKSVREVVRFPTLSQP